MFNAVPTANEVSFDPTPSDLPAAWKARPGQPQGLTYIIRFLKGWKHGVHAFRGETLPIHRDGSDTAPWDEVHSQPATSWGW
jgi:hypothetical protein